MYKIVFHRALYSLLCAIFILFEKFGWNTLVTYYCTCDFKKGERTRNLIVFFGILDRRNIVQLEVLRILEDEEEKWRRWEKGGNSSL